jgi:hypothetical protein
MAWLTGPAAAELGCVTTGTVGSLIVRNVLAGMNPQNYLFEQVIDEGPYKEYS